MLTFDKKSFTVCVDTGLSPEEEWLKIMNGLLDLLHFTRSDTIIDDTFYSVILLLQSMLPDPEQARKML